MISIFFFQAEDGIRDYKVTGVQTCALPIQLVSIKSGGSAATRNGHYKKRGAAAARIGKNKKIGRASCRERV